MAHFAQLNENNVVLNVITVADSDTQDSNGVEVESIGTHAEYAKKKFN